MEIPSRSIQIQAEALSDAACGGASAWVESMMKFLKRQIICHREN
jgi:hypothetical protein